MQDEKVLKVYDDGDDVEGHALSFHVPWEQIDEAMSTDAETLELLLAVEGRWADDEQAFDTETIAIEFGRDELEQLFEADRAGPPTFAIDRADLEQALAESDVEAHGFKKALVVTSIAGALIAPSTALGGVRTPSPGGEQASSLRTGGSEAGVVKAWQAKKLRGYGLRAVKRHAVAQAPNIDPYDTSFGTRPGEASETGPR